VLLKRLGKASAIYSAANILQRGGMLLLLPLYSKYLSPTDYGTVTVIMSIVGGLAVLASFSLPAAITRFYFELINTRDEFGSMLATMVAFVLTSVLLIGGILYLVGDQFFHPLIFPLQFWPYMATGLGILMLQPLITILFILLQTEERPILYAAYALGQFVLNLMLAFYFMAELKMKAEAPLLATLISTGLTAFPAMIYLSKRMCFRFSGRYLKTMLIYSTPLLPHAIAGQVQSVADRMLVNRLVNTAAAGHYSIGYMIAGVMAILTESVNRAYIPIATSAHFSRDTEQIEELKKMAELLVAFYGFVALCVSTLSLDVIALVVGDRYLESATVVPFISFAFVCSGIYYILGNIFFLAPNATKYISFGTISGATCNIIFNLLLIPSFGLVGAGLSALLAQVVTTSLIGIIGRRFETIRWNYFRIISPALFYFCCASIISVFASERSIVTLLIKCMALLIIFFTGNFFLWKDIFYPFRILSMLRPQNCAGIRP
jgi:O-antigen/teichoic acid export membrane protein